MSFYKNIYINLPYNTVKHIIGKNASNFSRMSEKCNLNYIWYNKDTNAITLYGENDKMDEAVKYVKKVIEAYTRKFSPDFVDNIYNTNTMDEVCTELSLKNVLDEEHVKHLIGHQGITFKNITRKTNVYYIWYDKQNHVIKIWGTQYHTLNAIKMIHETLDKVRITIQKHEQVKVEPLKKRQRTC
jgi:hypothetical protein